MTEPAKAFRKEACGSGTLFTPPPRTTKPVIVMKKRIVNLIATRVFINPTPALGVRVCMIVTAKITATAIPRSFHAVTVWSAATRILDAKTMQPEAVKPSKTAWVEKRAVARSFGLL